MLNEFLEFQAYVKEPRSEKPRIQPKYFTGSFSENGELNGLEQILTVIARGVLFPCDGQKDNAQANDTKEGRIEDTIEILRRWCGFDDIESGEREDAFVRKWFMDYPEAEGWLHTYWNYHFDKCKKSPKAKDELWKNAKKRKEVLEGTHDYMWNKISYKNVIANALELGPLRERYLVLKKDKNQNKVKEKKIFEYLYQMREGSSKKQEKTQHRFLKQIAAYLILQEQHPKGQEEVFLRKGPLLGWYGKDDPNGEKSSWCIEDMWWNDKPIFSIKGSGSYIKLIVDLEYLRTFDFRIIKPDEIEKYRKDYWILKDCGHGKLWKIIN